MPPAAKLAALEEARSEALGLASAGTGAPDGDPVLAALADAGRRYPIPMQEFGELIDGCIADVNGAAYATFGDLLSYCRCVAGSIGRLSLGVFGAPDMRAAEPLADSLGVALQLTNILRDIREDYRNGRVYLPAEDLDRFGCELKPAAGTVPGAEPAPDAASEARLIRLIEFEASRARDWYATGLRLLPMLDGRSAACTGAMAGIYRGLLDRIAAEPAAVLHGRVSLSSREKVMVAVRSLARPLLPGRGRAARPQPGLPADATAPAARAEGRRR
jgi:phytoene synthase